MKKYFISTVLLFAVLFYGCSQWTNLSVEKRHYRNGFYFSYNKQATKDIPSSAEIVKQEKSSADNSTASVKNEPAVPKFSGLPQEIMPVHSHSEKRKIIKNEIKKVQNIFTEKNSIKRVKQITQQIKTLKHDDDGLSFFWSIIVLIVIIWLIAYFTGGWGLGGLINLLLVVAVILFVLWLLRIV